MIYAYAYLDKNIGGLLHLLIAGFPLADGLQELRENIARLQGQPKPVGFEHPGRDLV